VLLVMENNSKRKHNKDADGEDGKDADGEDDKDADGEDHNARKSEPLSSSSLLARP